MKRLISECKNRILFLFLSKNEYEYEALKIWESWGLVYNFIEVRLKITRRLVYKDLVGEDSIKTIRLYFHKHNDSFSVNPQSVHIERMETTRLSDFRFAPLSDDICKKALKEYSLRNNFPIVIDGKTIHEIW